MSLRQTVQFKSPVGRIALAMDTVRHEHVACIVGNQIRFLHMAQQPSFPYLTLKRESIIADDTQCLTFTPRCPALGKLARNDSCEPFAKPFGNVCLFAV